MKYGETQKRRSEGYVALPPDPSNGGWMLNVDQVNATERTKKFRPASESVTVGETTPNKEGVKWR